MGVVPMAVAPAEPGVYFAWCTAVPGYIKIGWSKNPRKRLRHLQTGLPGPVFVLRFDPGPKALERALHDGWSHRRAHGEWFRVDLDMFDSNRGTPGIRTSVAG